MCLVTLVFLEFTFQHVAQKKKKKEKEKRKKKKNEEKEKLII